MQAIMQAQGYPPEQDSSTPSESSHRQHYQDQAMHFPPSNPNDALTYQAVIAGSETHRERML